MDKYRVRITAKPRTTLLGGVRTILSEAWPLEDAKNLLDALMDQPNAEKGELIKVVAKRRSRRACR